MAETTSPPPIPHGSQPRASGPSEMEAHAKIRIRRFLQEIEQKLSCFTTAQLERETTSISTADIAFFSDVTRSVELIRTHTQRLNSRAPTREMFRELFDLSAGFIRNDFDGCVWNLERYLSNLIKYVFEQPRRGDPDRTPERKLLSELDPYTFILLSMIPTKHRAKNHVYDHNPDLWYIIKVAKEYLKEAKFPPNWIFHEPFRMAIEKQTKLPTFGKFKTEYHRIESELDADTTREEDVEETSAATVPKRKRVNLEATGASYNTRSSKRTRRR